MWIPDGVLVRFSIVGKGVIFEDNLSFTYSKLEFCVHYWLLYMKQGVESNELYYNKKLASTPVSVMLHVRIINHIMFD